MDADSFVNIVLEKIEKPDKSEFSLANKLRKSHNISQGTVDGLLVNAITSAIEDIIDESLED
jgi:hypothetical protein